MDDADLYTLVAKFDIGEQVRTGVVCYSSCRIVLKYINTSFTVINRNEFTHKTQVALSTAAAAAGDGNVPVAACAGPAYLPPA